MSQYQPHDEFLELCAVATSGQLSADEHKRLQEHLAECSSCREAMQQYEAIAGKVIPALAPELMSDPHHEDPDWSENRAEAALFSRLEEEERGSKFSDPQERDRAQTGARRGVGSAGELIWRHVWLQYAAGIVLVIALGISVYQLGLHRGVETASSQAPPTRPVATPTEQQLSDVGYEHRQLQQQMKQREETIADLRHQLAQQDQEIGRLKNVESQLQTARSTNAAQSAQVGADLRNQLEAAQTKANQLQESLNLQARQASQESSRSKQLEAQVLGLTAQLHDRDETIEQQQELLAHDRDIRELMGARDLYIAEVYDVAGTGATKKPYGRVFYTKGKSLVFYAYDLDQQRGLKNAASFQAWGSRGTNWKQAQSLGIFYEDSAAKKRWVLRFDDPRTLAQIDTVFVTVEPSGGSHKPSGQRLLFAYLKIDPNHP